MSVHWSLAWGPAFYLEIWTWVEGEFKFLEFPPKGCEHEKDTGKMNWMPSPCVSGNSSLRHLHPSTQVAIPMEEYRKNYNLLQFSLVSNLAVDNSNQVILCFPEIKVCMNNGFYTEQTNYFHYESDLNSHACTNSTPILVTQLAVTIHCCVSWL